MSSYAVQITLWKSTCTISSVFQKVFWNMLKIAKVTTQRAKKNTGIQQKETYNNHSHTFHCATA